MPRTLVLEEPAGRPGSAPSARSSRAWYTLTKRKSTSASSFLALWGHWGKGRGCYETTLPHPPGRTYQLEVPNRWGQKTQGSPRTLSPPMPPSPEQITVSETGTTPGKALKIPLGQVPCHHHGLLTVVNSQAGHAPPIAHPPRLNVAPCTLFLPSLGPNTQQRQLQEVSPRGKRHSRRQPVSHAASTVRKQRKAGSQLLFTVLFHLGSQLIKWRLFPSQ